MEELIKKQIEGALKHWVMATEKNYPDMHSRVDELFLLWSKVACCSFKETCESFGLNYEDFNQHKHHNNIQQIRIKFKGYFEQLEKAY